MRYIVITWDSIPPSPNAFIPGCLYHCVYAYLDFLLVEESKPYEVTFAMPNPYVIPV